MLRSKVPKVGLVFVIGCVMLLNLVRMVLSRPVDAMVNHGVSISPAFVDLGEIRQGETRGFSVTLKNIEAHRVDNITLTPSCACTLVQNPSQVLMSAESTRLLGQFESNARRGVYATHLLLSFNADGETVEQVLPLKVTVKPFVTYQPSQVEFSMSADPSTDKTSIRTIAFTVTEHPNLELIRTDCWHPAFTIVPVESGENRDLSSVPQPSHVRALVVSFDPEQWNSYPRTGDRPVSLLVSTNIDTEPTLVVPIVVK